MAKSQNNYSRLGKTLRQIFWSVTNKWSSWPTWEEKMIDFLSSSRVSILIDIAGMGKTTVLNHLAEQMKERYPHHWIINIDLKRLHKWIGRSDQILKWKYLKFWVNGTQVESFHKEKLLDFIIKTMRLYFLDSLDLQCLLGHHNGTINGSKNSKWF